MLTTPFTFSRLKRMSIYKKGFLIFFILNAILKVYIGLYAWIGYYDTRFLIAMAQELAGRSLHPVPGMPGIETELVSYASYERPPLIPVIFAALIKLGLESGSAFSLVGIAFNLLACLATYIFVSKIYNEELGLLSSVLLALNWHYWWYSAAILQSIPGSAMTIITLLFFYKGLSEKEHPSLWLSGFLCALAILTRETNFLLPLICLLYLLTTKRLKWLEDKNIYIASILFLTVSIIYTLLAYQTYGDSAWPHWLEQYLRIISNLSRTTYFGGESVKKIAGSPYVYYIYFAPYVFSLFGCLLALVGLVATAKRQDLRKEGKILVILYLAIFFLIQTLIGVKDEYYFIYWTPAFMTFAALGLSEVGRISKKLFMIILPVTIISVYNARYLPFVKFLIEPPYVTIQNLLLAHYRIIESHAFPPPPCQIIPMCNFLVIAQMAVFFGFYLFPLSRKNIRQVPLRIKT